MDERKKILWNSFVLTVLIFVVGILINHGLDVFRIDTIESVMRVHEIDSDAYRVESLFAGAFGNDECEVMVGRISDLKKEIRQVGEDLGSYSGFSFFRKTDYDYLKRKYFLLELEFLSLIKRLNVDCAKPYLPVLFFYKIDDDASERQGLILQDLSEEFDEQVVVLSLDRDYKDEPLVGVLAEHYNVTSSPTVIVDNAKFEGLTSGDVLNSAFQQYLQRADPFAVVDFSLVPLASGIDIDLLYSQLFGVINNESSSLWGRGDSSLVLGRLLKNSSLICSSLKFFDDVVPSSAQEAALLYETSASLGCGRNRPAFLRAAAQQWRVVGNEFRASLLESIAQGRQVKLIFDPVAVGADFSVISDYVSPLKPILPNVSVSKVIIGRTGFSVGSGDVVFAQVDRVYRDWLGGQLSQSPFEGDLLTTFSERLYYNDSELRSDVGWHEGGRLRDLSQIGVSPVTAVGTLVAKNNGRWFAVDDSGVFRFEVPIDKVSYPTTRFLRRDLAVIIDSHGMNMVVEQALRGNASLVVACCDHPGKVYAAKYLSDRGVNVACLPDKYLYLALGHNLSVVGSPPVIVGDSSAVFGSREISISRKDVVVAVNATSQHYALWYYQTPASYFSVFDEAGLLNVKYVTIHDFGSMPDVIEQAESLKATVLAARVFNKSDYDAVRSWLLADESRRAVLFHSASYPYGQLLLREFDRVSFDDPNPVFV